MGPRSFNVAATDNAGNDTSLTHDYRIVYPFGGFQAPVDGEPTLNTARAGSVIPVKFTLGGDHGLGILASGSPSSTRFEAAGSLLSTMLPAIGPAVAQLPALSQTWRLFVEAFASSVPTATFVEREKLASPASASPDSASEAAQAMLTSAGCQAPSAEPHSMVGGVVSAAGASPW